MEYYRVAGDHESIGRVSSILGGDSPSAVASRIEEADTPEELRMAFSSSDLLVSSQPEDRRAEVRATIKKFMSLKFSQLQEERRLKLAFLNGHLSREEYESALSRIREMEEILRQRVGRVEETPELVREKLRLFNELYLDGFISRGECERRKRVLKARLKALEGWHISSYIAASRRFRVYSTWSVDRLDICVVTLRTWILRLGIVAWTVFTVVSTLSPFAFMVLRCGWQR